MIKNKKLLLILSVVFLAIESMLGILMQKFQGEIPINLRFTSVVLACLFFVLFAEKSHSFAFTLIALVFTVGADYFLVFPEWTDQLSAMILFSVVQLAYFFRLFFEEESTQRKRIHLTARLILCVIAVSLPFFILGDGADALTAVSMFYYANLLTNVIFAFISFKKKTVLALGLLLFVLCDTVIGLSFVNNIIPIENDPLGYMILHPGFDLVWAFYLPSQALLAISLLPDRLRKTN